jgi:hypothetical protein
MSRRALSLRQGIDQEGEDGDNIRIAALTSHGRGHWFEPSTAHHAKAPAKQTSRKFQEKLLFPEWLLFEHFGTVLGQCQWRAE